MDERKLRSAYATVEICAALRLLGTLFLVFLMLLVSGNFHHNIALLHHDSNLLYIAVASLAVDSLLTLLWPLMPKLFKVHFILFILMGLIEYSCVVQVSQKIKIIGPGFIAVLLLAVILCVINLIIFMTANNAINTINKLEEIRDAIEYDADDTAH